MFTENELEAARLNKSILQISKKKNLSSENLTFILLTLLASFHLFNQSTYGNRESPLHKRIWRLLYQLDATQADGYEFFQAYTELARELGVENKEHRLDQPNFVYFLILDITLLSVRKVSAIELFDAIYRNFLLQRHGGSTLTDLVTSEISYHLLPTTSTIYMSILTDSELPRILRFRNESSSRLVIVYDTIVENEFLLHLSAQMFNIELILAPHKNALVDLAFIQPFDSTQHFRSDSIEILDQVFARHVKFDFAVVAVSESDGTNSQVSAMVRKHIVEQRLLVAVIQLGDIQENTSNHSIFATTVWIVRASPIMSVDEVLFIDARALIEADKGNRATYAAAYAVELIDFWLYYKKNNQVGRSNRDLGHLSGNFTRNFRKGYHDVENLCFAVSRKNIKRASWSLRSTSYVKKKGVRNLTLPKVDSIELENKLRKNLSNGLAAAAYIIGNNGAGKSALLNQLATTFRSHQTGVSGIALSLVDRFPFSKTGAKQDSGFTYFGMRTTETTINMKSHASLLNSLLKTVQTEQIRLNAFRLILDAVGFREQLYLIPLTQGGDEDASNQPMLEMVEGLTFTAEENLKIYRNFRSSTSTFGLRTKNSEQEIHEFIHLSSGEQQLLTLAIKLCTSARDRSLILIDEPEISLHVAWQRAIPKVMNIVCENLRSNIVIATHSPVIISAALELDYDCYTAKNWQLVEIDSTQRSSVDAVLFDSFETYTSNTRRVSEHCAAVVANAIRKVNTDDHTKEEFQPILKELDAATRIIQAAAEVLGRAATGGDLELVKRARDAINEISDSGME